MKYGLNILSTLAGISTHSHLFKTDYLVKLHENPFSLKHLDSKHRKFKSHIVRKKGYGFKNPVM
jgi:hypothetical protein